VNVRNAVSTNRELSEPLHHSCCRSPRATAWRSQTTRSDSRRKPLLHRASRDRNWSKKTRKFHLQVRKMGEACGSVRLYQSK